MSLKTKLVENELITGDDVPNHLSERELTQQESDHALSSFFRAAPVLLGIVELKEPARHIALNPQAASFFRTTEAEAKGKTLAELNVPEPVSQQWQQAFWQSLAEQHSVQFKCELERRHLRVTVHFIEGSSHSTPRCCYIAEDTTQLAQAEAHQRLLETAIEKANDIIVITEPELELAVGGPKIIYVNQAFTEMTGYERDEVLGKTPRILQGPMTDPSVLGRLRQSLLKTGSFSAETINYRKDGQPFILEWKIASLQDEEENVIYWVASQRDVTQRRRLEKQVLEAQAREQERLARDLHDSVLPNLISCMKLNDLFL
ncbi:MAG: PAS domain S-box protein [Cyanophyceae cyanobacterium]